MEDQGGQMGRREQFHLTWAKPAHCDRHLFLATFALPQVNLLLLCLQANNDPLSKEQHLWFKITTRE